MDLNPSAWPVEVSNPAMTSIWQITCARTPAVASRVVGTTSVSPSADSWSILTCRQKSASTTNGSLHSLWT